MSIATGKPDWANVGRGLRESHWKGRLQNWGLAGVGKSAASGAAASFGFFKTEGAPGLGYRFLGGASVGRSIAGMGIGAGVGAMVYAATDNPLLAAGAGLMTAKAAGVGFGSMMKIAGPMFIAHSMMQGYREGGFGGALKAGAGDVATFAAFDVGMKGLGVAFKGAPGGVSLMAVALPAAVIAGIGYGAYKGAKALASRGRDAVRTEFTGSTAAFNTQAAYTMRQRALQEISRSHTNARTILGNEASLVHM